MILWEDPARIEDWYKWASTWNVQLGEPLKVKRATPKTWAKCVSGTTKYPGRNNPAYGPALLDIYKNFTPLLGCDPMAGVGGLWLNLVHKFKRIDLCDCVAWARALALDNLSAQWTACKGAALKYDLGDAKVWSPIEPVDMILTSFPYRQNKSSGATVHQQKDIVENKYMGQFQKFPDVPGVSLTEDIKAGSSSGVFYQRVLDVYSKMLTYLKPTGHAFIVLRNLICSGVEIDEVGKHIEAARTAGFVLDTIHPIALKPGGFMQWKVSKDSSTPYIKTEWVLNLVAPEVNNV